jgi:hypothetical protein
MLTVESAFLRLQVFLHVFSAMQMVSGIRFGDYKNAHTREFTREFKDPRWLHAAEVSFVKVVLLRLVKSQLGGVALLNAFNKHAGLRLTGKSRCKRAIILARGIVEALRQALHDKDGSASSCTYEFLVDKLKVLSSQLTSQVFPACDLLCKRKHVHNAHSNPCQSLLLTISLGHRD